MSRNAQRMPLAPPAAGVIVYRLDLKDFGTARCLELYMRRIRIERIYVALCQPSTGRNIGVESSPSRVNRYRTISPPTIGGIETLMDLSPLLCRIANRVWDSDSDEER